VEQYYQHMKQQYDAINHHSGLLYLQQLLHFQYPTQDYPMN